MALNVKLAVLISFAAVGAMCWLVNQVARPMVAAPSLPPIDVRQAGLAADNSRPRSPARSEPTFDFASAVEPGMIAPASDRDAPRVAHGATNEPQLPPRRVAVSQPVEEVSLTGEQPSDAAAVVHATPRRPSPPLVAVRPVAEEVDWSWVEDEPLQPALPRSGGLAADVLSREPAPAARETAGARETAPAGRSSPAGTYTVQRGDSLARVARKVWGTAERAQIDALLEANPRVKQRKGVLWVDEELVIPTSTALAAAPRGATPARATEAPRPGTTAAAARPATGREPAGTARRPEPAARQYVVQRGDSLTKIAQRELKDGSRWREILQLNKLRDANHLIPGSRILLPVDERNGA